ncbi:MAG: magnesium transporter CorA family protein, partial [Bifidobacteriaceae bacterium]|nr:magnesium transporter CorA family protein [Bifidobacteriaceae bacterium]
LAKVSDQFAIDLADLRASLDDEERSRVDVEDSYTMIVVDIPTVENRGGRDWYETIPLSIIITDNLIITVCSVETPVLQPFIDGKIRNFNTFMRSRFILQILYRNAQQYLRYLRIVDRESDKLELRLYHAMQNKEIIMLMELSKTLVYFATSLKSNEIVLEKLTSLERIKQYPDDEDLLGDVIVENKQAIEMASIYSGVLQGMMDAFGSIVSNNLNNVMRIFTIISIVISIPTLIFSAYGMNLSNGTLFFEGNIGGFVIICVISLAIALIAALVLTKSRLFR